MKYTLRSRMLVTGIAPALLAEESKECRIGCMEPNPYQSPQPTGYGRKTPPRSLLKDKLLLVLIGAVIIAFGFGSVCFFYFGLIRP